MKTFSSFNDKNWLKAIFCSRSFGGLFNNRARAWALQRFKVFQTEFNLLFTFDSHSERMIN